MLTIEIVYSLAVILWKLKLRNALESSPRKSSIVNVKPGFFRSSTLPPFGSFFLSFSEKPIFYLFSVHTNNAHSIYVT